MLLVLTDENEFLYQDMDTGSIMRYNATTNTESVFVNSSVSNNNNNNNNNTLKCNRSTDLFLIF